MLSAGECVAPVAMPPSAKSAANGAGAKPAEQHVADLLKRLEDAEARHKVSEQGGALSEHVPCFLGFRHVVASRRPGARRLGGGGSLSKRGRSSLILRRDLQSEKECLLKEHKREVQDMKDKFSERNNTLVKGIDQLRNEKKQAQVVASAACDELKKVRILLSVLKAAGDEAEQFDPAGRGSHSRGRGNKDTQTAPAAPREPTREKRANLDPCEGHRDEAGNVASGSKHAPADDKENVLNQKSSKAPAARRKVAPQPVRGRVTSLIPTVLESVPEEEETLGILPNGPGGAQEGTWGSSECDEQEADVPIVLGSPTAKQHLEWDTHFQEDSCAPADSQADTASSRSKLRRRASDSFEPHHGGPRAQGTRMLPAEIPNEKKEFVLHLQEEQDERGVKNSGCSIISATISGERNGARCAHAHEPSEPMLPDALLARARALTAEEMKTLSAKAPSHLHDHPKEREARFQGEASANVAGVSVASGDRMDVTDTVSMLTDTVSESIGESGEGDRESLPQRKRDREQDEADPMTQPSEEEGRQLRRRQSLVNYAEPSLHQKLRQGDAHTFNSGETLSAPGVVFFC